MLQTDWLIQPIGCSRAHVYLRRYGRILLVLLSVPKARPFFFALFILFLILLELTSSLKRARGSSVFVIFTHCMFYIIHSDF